MKPSAPAIARMDFFGCTAKAAILDLRPIMRVSPLSFELSIASNIRDLS
ncbi:MAG: hypothetical protein RLZZ629_665 [Actinomycetota bacterium]